MIITGGTGGCGIKEILFLEIILELR